MPKHALLACYIDAVVTPFALMPLLLNNHINGNGIAVHVHNKSLYDLSEGDFGSIHPGVSCNACCLYCTRFDYFSLPVHGITQVAGIANRKITTCNQLTDTDSSHAAEAAFTSETFNSSQSSFPFSQSANSQYIGCLSVCGTTVCTCLNLYRQHRSVRGAIPASSVPVSSAASVRSHVTSPGLVDTLAVHWLRPDDLTRCGGSDNYR